jgi:glutaredoxin
VKYILILITLSTLLISCISNNKQIKREEIKPTISTGDVVIIYSASWCHWCKVAKQFLEDNKIEYIEKDLEDSQHWKELKIFAKSISYKGNLNVVPLFIVKNKIIIGYQPLEILTILGRKKGVMKTYSKNKLENGLRGSIFVK